MFVVHSGMRNPKARSSKSTKTLSRGKKDPAVAEARADWLAIRVAVEKLGHPREEVDHIMRAARDICTDHDRKVLVEVCSNEERLREFVRRLEILEFGREAPKRDDTPKPRRKKGGGNWLANKAPRLPSGLLTTRDGMVIPDHSAEQTKSALIPDPAGDGLLTNAQRENLIRFLQTTRAKRAQLRIRVHLQIALHKPVLTLRLDPGDFVTSGGTTNTSVTFRRSRANPDWRPNGLISPASAASGIEIPAVERYSWLTAGAWSVATSLTTAFSAELPEEESITLMVDRVVAGPPVAVAGARVLGFLDCEHATDKELEEFRACSCDDDVVVEDDSLLVSVYQLRSDDGEWERVDGSLDQEPSLGELLLPRVYAQSVRPLKLIRVKRDECRPTVELQLGEHSAREYLRLTSKDVFEDAQAVVGTDTIEQKPWLPPNLRHPAIIDSLVEIAGLTRGGGSTGTLSPESLEKVLSDSKLMERTCEKAIKRLSGDEASKALEVLRASIPHIAVREACQVAAKLREKMRRTKR